MYCQNNCPVIFQLPAIVQSSPAGAPGTIVPSVFGSTVLNTVATVAPTTPVPFTTLSTGTTNPLVTVNAGLLSVPISGPYLVSFYAIVSNQNARFSILNNGNRVETLTATTADLGGGTFITTLQGSLVLPLTAGTISLINDLLVPVTLTFAAQAGSGTQTLAYLSLYSLF